MTEKNNKDSDLINVQIKTLNDPILNFTLPKSNTVHQLKNLIIENQNLQGKWLRLIYQGKILEDDQPLSTYSDLKDNCFIHCAVSDEPPASHTIAEQPQNDREIDLEQLERGLLLSDNERSSNPTSVEFLNVEGTNVDLFFGMLMGFLLGVIMLLWLWEPSLSRRQKIGILASVE